MRAGWLADAVAELTPTGAEKVVLLWGRGRDDELENEVNGYRERDSDREARPWFALKGSGILGSARIEFSGPSPNSPHTTPAPPPQDQNNPAPSAPPPSTSLETFQLAPKTKYLRHAYKFSLLQKAAKAMAVATKVSIRCDNQGVLSLQFMIEVEQGKVSFVDFRFVPLVEEGVDRDDGEDEGSSGGDSGSGGEEEVDGDRESGEETEDE